MPKKKSSNAKYLLLLALLGGGGYYLYKKKNEAGAPAIAIDLDTGEMDVVPETESTIPVSTIVDDEPLPSTQKIASSATKPAVKVAPKPVVKKEVIAEITKPEKDLVIPVIPKSQTNEDPVPRSIKVENRSNTGSTTRTAGGTRTVNSASKASSHIDQEQRRVVDDQPRQVLRRERVSLSAY